MSTCAVIVERDGRARDRVAILIGQRNHQGLGELRSCRDSLVVPGTQGHAGDGSSSNRLGE